MKICSNCIPHTLVFLSVFFVLISCKDDNTANDIICSDVIELDYDYTNIVESMRPEENCVDMDLSCISISDNFQNWLKNNEYGQYNFASNAINGDSYGGFIDDGQQVKHDPVIFIHGNSDKALGNSFGQSGWTESIEYFLCRGYNSAELYAFTWGEADPSKAHLAYHSKENTMRVRKFIEAVLDYTGASKVDVISHSMGVTLARKAILGGNASDALDGGVYNVGNPLTEKIDAFIGIGGANQGLVSCFVSGPITPTCGTTNGFYPGVLDLFGNVNGQANILKNINATANYEGQHVYSIWSSADQIIGYGGLVYGKITSRIPQQDGEKKYSQSPYGHFNIKDLTANIQYQMAVNHKIN